MWPFRRKSTAPEDRKSTAYFFSPGSARSGLSGAAYDRLAKEGYIECVVAFACINKIASAVASSWATVEAGRPSRSYRCTHEPSGDCARSRNRQKSRATSNESSSHNAVIAIARSRVYTYGYLPAAGVASKAHPRVEATEARRKTSRETWRN